MTLQDAINTVNGIDGDTHLTGQLYQDIFGPVFSSLQTCLDKVADFEALEASGVSAALQNITDTIAPQLANEQAKLTELVADINLAKDQLLTIQQGGISATNVGIPDGSGVEAETLDAAILELSQALGAAAAAIADRYTKEAADNLFLSQEAAADQYLDFANAQALTEAQKGQAQANIGLGGGWNWIINGDFTVNRRGGTRNPGIGVYGYDRWKGHADGLEQMIESLPAGDYTLTWTGGGTGTIGGVTAASPIYVTGLSGGQTSVVVPSDAARVSVCKGDCRAMTYDYDCRSYQAEVELCRRYYEKLTVFFIGNVVSNGFVGSHVTYPTKKRVIPAVSVMSVLESQNIGAINFGPITDASLRVYTNVPSDGDSYYSAIVELDAEI
ncbi:hypothetical protein SAMN04515647_4380 [Cohaesibacter sp. ES.047]|uniref:hypothetical protein n=1 Tax=Cohaesibacter sp. ES.047 TaxID=1798205 RepID=UPI000BB76640|nr:hypothetical protein [Cohaesibacter sp. ES.047]SNY94056.1 hypothetical protein SAMN04515647_4380 [Cohaesibacter sp. ES.047]